MSILLVSIIVGFAIPVLVMIVMALLEPLLKRYHTHNHTA